MQFKTKYPILSLALVLASGAAWVVVAIRLGVGVSQSHASSLLLRLGAVDGPTLESGQFWRLLTSQFLHVHPLHMLFNLVGIFLLASALERAAGGVTMITTYFFGGTAGQYFSALLQPDQVSSGASQALMALCGFTLLAYGRLPLSRTVLFSAAAVAAIQILLDVSVVGAIKPGHSFGLMAGIALATFQARFTILRPST